MKQIVLSLAILPLLGIAGRAQVLFTNFGPGYAYDTSAWYVGGSSSGCAQVTAAKFTPLESALFQDAKLALKLTAGTNQVSVYLETDSGGDPGTIIEGPINVTGLVGPPGSVITAPSTLHPLLQAGTPYWLTVTSSNADTCALWYFNSTGDVNDGTNLAFHPFSSSLSGPWVNGGSSPTRPAFQIDGVQIAGNGAPFQIRYVSHLDIGDSVVNITNDGQTLPVFDPVLPTASNLCIGVYTFDANEELQSCCACLVTPNGLASLSAQALTATSLTGEKPTSLVVKLLAWSTTAGASSTAPPGTPAPPTSSACNPATPGTLAAGMHAWGTTIHPLPSGGRSTYTVTETEFSPAALSAAEYAHITQSCEFNQINGSAQSGQCKGCTSGGQ